MRVKGFFKFIGENVREDDFSYLNDDLIANKKNEARWPDDDDYEDGYDYEDDDTKDYGYYDDWYDDSDDDNYKPKRSSNPKFDDDNDDYNDDDVEGEDDGSEHLNYLLRQMFRNAGVGDVRITSVKNEEILIECHIPKETTLRNVIKIFEVANKLKRDILAQYDTEFDIWQGGEKGILMFDFLLNEGLEDDSLPF